MSEPWKGPLRVTAEGYIEDSNGATRVGKIHEDTAHALVHRANAYEGLVEAVRSLIADVQDEHEAHEAEDEGFIVALHVPYGDVLRARRTLDSLEEDDD